MNDNKKYENMRFPYSYPYSWEKRNRVYLKLYEDRPLYKDYMLPSVFRLRFYSKDYNIISDDFYTPSNNTIRFPIPEEVPSKRFAGWAFLYNGNTFIVTPDNYESLNNAIIYGEDDIELIAVYEQGLPIAVVDVALVDFSVTGY